MQPPPPDTVSWTVTSQLALSSVNLTSPAWSLSALSAAVSSSLGISQSDVSATVTSYGVTTTLQLASAPANQSAAAAALAALFAAQAGVSPGNVSVTAAPSGRRHVLQSGSVALLVHIGGLPATNPGSVAALQQQLQSPALTAAASTALQVPVTGSSAAVDAVLVIVVSAATQAVTASASTLLAAGSQPTQLTAALQAAGLPAAGVAVLTAPQAVQQDSSLAAPPAASSRFLPPPTASPQPTPAAALLPPPPPPAQAAPPPALPSSPPSPPPAGGSSGTAQRLSMPAAEAAAISVAVAAVACIAAVVFAVCRRRRRMLVGVKKQARMPRILIGSDSDVGASSFKVDSGASSASDDSQTPIFTTAFVRRLSEWQAALRVSTSEGSPTFGSLLKRLSDGMAAMRISSSSSSGNDSPSVTPPTPRLRRISSSVAALLPRQGEGSAALEVQVPTPRNGSPRDEEDNSPTYGVTPSARFEEVLDAQAPAAGAAAAHPAGGGAIACPLFDPNTPSWPSPSAAVETPVAGAVAIAMPVTADHGMGSRLKDRRTSRGEQLVSHVSAQLGRLSSPGLATGFVSPPRGGAGRRMSSPGMTGGAFTSPPRAMGNRRLSSPGKIVDTGRRPGAGPSPGRHRFSSPPIVRTPALLPIAPEVDSRTVTPGSGDRLLPVSPGDGTVEQPPVSPRVGGGERARPKWRP